MQTCNYHPPQNTRQSGEKRHARPGRGTLTSAHPTDEARRLDSRRPRNHCTRTIGNSAFAVLLAALFGVLGYIFMRLDCEPAPMILGFVLGPLMEDNLRRSMRISGGDPMIFVERPIAFGLLIAAAILLIIVTLPAIRSRREQAFRESG